MGRVATIIGAALRSPRCVPDKIRHPTMISFGLYAALQRFKRRATDGSPDAIYDVGANRGQFAFMASRTWPGVPVTSFEPDPDEFVYLERAFKQFAILGSCHRIALADTSGARTLFMQQDSAQNSLLRGIVSDGVECPVECASLDAILPVLPPFDHGWLKVDTQGSDAAVLQGGRDALARFRYVQLEIAFRPSYRDQPPAHVLFRMMHDAGFECIELLDVLRDHRGVLEADFLFKQVGT